MTSHSCPKHYSFWNLTEFWSGRLTNLSHITQGSGKTFFTWCLQRRSSHAQRNAKPSLCWPGPALREASGRAANAGGWGRRLLPPRAGWLLRFTPRKSGSLFPMKLHRLPARRRPRRASCPRSQKTLDLQKGLSCLLLHSWVRGWELCKTPRAFQKGTVRVLNAKHWTKGF